MKCNHSQQKNVTQLSHYMNSSRLTQNKTQMTQSVPCHTGSNSVIKVCQLESIDYLKSKTEMGYVFFVRNTKGSQSQLKWLWDENNPKRLPDIGSTLVIEYEQPKIIGRKVMTLSAITNWQQVNSKYSNAYLQLLFNKAGKKEPLVRLLALIDRLNDHRLKQLLTNIFHSQKIALPFITLPASYNHHHSYSGGLLQHSLECAEWVEALAYETLTPREAELTIVTALLHDLGKVETMTQTDSSQIVSHEIIVLSLLEPLLSQLQMHWKQGANVLRQMLGGSLQSSQFPKLPGQLLVKMADQYSTSLSARELAFKGQPDYYYWASLKTPTSIQFFNRIS